MNLTELLRRFWYAMIGVSFVASARAALDFPSIASTLQATLTISTPGAIVGDLVQFGIEGALEAGLQPSAYVSAADTVTVILSNNTAGAIDPASKAYQVVVTRRGR